MPMDIPHAIAAETSAAAAIAELIRESLGDDQEAIDISIASETSLSEVIAAALRRRDELESHAAAISHRIEILRARKARFVGTSERLWNAIETAMLSAGIGKLELPDVTVYTRQTAAVLSITDPAAIPTAFVKPQEPVFDRAGLTKALRAGAIIPGAVLVPGERSIGIKRT